MKTFGFRRPLRSSRTSLSAAVAAALVFISGVVAGCGNASSQGAGLAKTVGKRDTVAQEVGAEGDPKRSSAAASVAVGSNEKRRNATPRTSSASSGPASASVPKGMVYVPGGTTRIGITEETWKRVQRMQKPGARRPPWGRAARPSFTAEVVPFFLDKHPVTVAQFRQFVEEIGYETQAERFGNAGVMAGGRWRLVKGATWHHPRGPKSKAAPSDHPVTQVSWNDAVAYCEWKGRRLPTEVEWEHAARGADNDRVLCPDGKCPAPDAAGAPSVANTWQGRFPVRNTVADGFRYTSPVGAFGEMVLGLTDMSGNVWEWTSSWYRPYSRRGSAFRPTKRSEKVLRGGSFQCNECGGYRVFARSHATPGTSLFHAGFRCAKDAPARRESD